MLEDIGFYTMSDTRAAQAGPTSPLWRCELLLTDRCNFCCPYCRPLPQLARGTLSYKAAEDTCRMWLADGLKNVRFSGGEPTLWPGLERLVAFCRDGGCQRIAISTNGSASTEKYDTLLAAGVDDFSVSLDGGCCATSETMCGNVPGSWERVTENIRYLAARAYTTVGMVFTEQNIGEATKAVLFAHSLSVADIRIIPSAQYNRALRILAHTLPEAVLDCHPILRYRINNIRVGRHVRGNDENHLPCWLALDDMAVAGQHHWPCIIHLREGGQPIGEVNGSIRRDRAQWVSKFNPGTDPICRQMCLDVCIDYRRTVTAFRTAARDVEA